MAQGRTSVAALPNLDVRSSTPSVRRLATNARPCAITNQYASVAALVLREPREALVHRVLQPRAALAGVREHLQILAAFDPLGRTIALPDLVREQVVGDDHAEVVLSAVPAAVVDPPIRIAEPGGYLQRSHLSI